MIRLIFPVLYLFLSLLNAQSTSTKLFCSSGRPILTIIGPTYSKILDGQPYKIVASELTEKVRIVDNICFSYIKTLRNDTVLAYDTRTRIDGSLGASPSITQDGGPGVVISSSAACTYVDYGIATLEDCQVNIVYRYYSYGYCNNDMSRDNSGEVYALTSLNNTIDDKCRNRILQAFADFGFGDRSYYFYPQKLPSRCTSAQLCAIPTQFNTLLTQCSLAIY